jgi:hypothetical protein
MGGAIISPRGGCRRRKGTDVVLRKQILDLLEVSVP